MKKVLVVGLIAGTAAAGLFYITYKLNKRKVEEIMLDFFEHALGGN